MFYSTTKIFADQGADVINPISKILGNLLIDIFEPMFKAPKCCDTCTCVKNQVMIGKIETLKEIRETLKCSLKSAKELMDYAESEGLLIAEREGQFRYSYNHSWTIPIYELY